MASVPDRLPLRRLPMVAVIVAVAALVVGPWVVSPQSPAPPTPRVEASAALRTAPLVQTWPAATSGPAASDPRHVSPSHTGLLDEVGVAQDLKRVFDAHIDSPDPRLHQAAVRAFSACAPAFLPGSGETPSPDALIGALPQERRAEREAAYRALYARCAPLLGMGRDKLNALQRAVLASNSSREAGARAQSELAAGNDDVADQRIAQALAGGDPATVASLAGVAEAWARRSSAAPAGPERLAIARALDAALPWVACDMGMACGNDSLLALQACASQGQCEGDLPTRLAGAGLTDPAERAAIQLQRERLLGLLKEGRTLSMTELVP